MQRTFITVGLALWAGLAWFVLADELGWIRADVADPWIEPLSTWGAVFVGLALILRVLSPLTRWAQSNRCLCCATRTRRGHIYCADHLQATVNRIRDEEHQRTL